LNWFSDSDALETLVTLISSSVLNASGTDYDKEPYAVPVPTFNLRVTGLFSEAMELAHAQSETSCRALLWIARQMRQSVKKIATARAYGSPWLLIVN
jgi:hypothetical protein